MHYSLSLLFAASAFAPGVISCDTESESKIVQARIVDKDFSPGDREMVYLRYNRGNLPPASSDGPEFYITTLKENDDLVCVPTFDLQEGQLAVDNLQGPFFLPPPGRGKSWPGLSTLSDKQWSLEGDVLEAGGRKEFCIPYELGNSISITDPEMPRHRECIKVELSMVSNPDPTKFVSCQDNQSSLPPRALENSPADAVTDRESSRRGFSASRRSGGAFTSRGRRGAFGPRGSRVDFGSRGSRGDFGPRGSRGDFGSRGSRGDFGPRGSRGDFWSRGSRGDFGSRGSRGDFGSRRGGAFSETRGSRGAFESRRDSRASQYHGSGGLSESQGEFDADEDC